MRASDPVTGSRASPRGGRVGGLLTSTDIEFELLKGWAPPTEVGRLLLSAKRHSPLYLWLPACSLPTVLVRTTGELWSTQRHTGKLLLPRRHPHPISRAPQIFREHAVPVRNRTSLDTSQAVIPPCPSCLKLMVPTGSDAARPAPSHHASRRFARGARRPCGRRSGGLCDRAEERGLTRRHQKASIQLV